MTTKANIKTRLVVGMEIHVELATRSKMFTAAPNVANREFANSEPNTLLDPVVIGMPGTLPVINKRAVEMSVLVGLALNCSIATRTKWDRKSYYYPDLPKNYQISQYDLPLCYDGSFDIPADDPADLDNTTEQPPTKHIGILRAHLEEDAGKLLHEAPGGRPIDYSIVDLNRAGTPLLEIVTLPDFDSADQAVRFANMLRDLCRHLGVTEGIMQQGHMRFEPNINVHIGHEGKVYKTPIVEIKNLNSFKALHGSITHEYERQVDEWLETGRVMAAREKTTRGWDDERGVTTLQREKEDADEYRYFPDPDLVPVTIDDDWLAEIKASMPATPAQRRERYVDALGLSAKEADALLAEPGLCTFFEQVIDAGGEPSKTVTLLLNAGQKTANVRSTRVEQLGITPKQIAGILELAANEKVSSSAVVELFAFACDSDDDVEAIARDNGLLQVSDTSALDGYIDQVLAEPKNAKAVDDIKGGKDKAVGALMGQIMKLSKGQANPKVVRDMILARLR